MSQNYQPPQPGPQPGGSQPPYYSPENTNQPPGAYPYPPQAPQPPAYPPYYGQPAPAPHKSNSKGLIIGGGVVAALAIVAVIIVLLVNGSSATKTVESVPAVTAQPVAVTTVSAGATATAPVATAAPTTAVVKASPAPTGETGWKTYTVKAAGFSIALPPTWIQLDQDTFKQALDTGFDVIKSQNPNFNSQLEAQIKQAFATGLVKFYAFNSLATGFADNMNIIKQAVPAGSVTLDQFASINVSQIQTAFKLAQAPAHKRITLQAGEAEEVHYTYDVPLGGKTISVAITQYFLLADGNAYAISFGTTQENTANLEPSFQKIVESFQPLG